MKAFLLPAAAIILVALLISSLQGVEEPPAVPDPENMLFLQDGDLRIGIDRSKGASITWLSWNDYPENTVNIYDPGRLIQQSYYAGRRIDRRADGQHHDWSPWSWNPIQGGGVGSWARVTHFEKDNDGALFGETIPKLWDMPDEEATALMRQWTTLEPGVKNVVTVRCELISRRGESDRWGAKARNPQELPATYFTRNFDTFKSYLGDGKWKTETTAPGPPWGRTKIQRKAMACFDASGQGIAIFSPNAESWNFGPHAKSGTSDPLAGPCVHIAPVAFVPLGPRSTLRYRYWLVVGTDAEIAKSLDLLWQRHSTERLQLSPP
ncbi:hypothetical protein ACFQY0_02465 [Haloferula chungangensis]|uniref:Uncharacterized protein n=1 Tax=Haloferula chungangensis TaxID=1048331 RepID=A0ABW2L131_9BACT